MESDCRIPVTCCRPRVLLLHALFWVLVSLGVYGASLRSEVKTTAALKPAAAPCWLTEEFVVSEACVPCSDFISTQMACRQTGYIERVNCTKSSKEEYKSCRSALMEEHLFWKFEAAMLALTALFAIMVVIRQRRLDRLASEKVRRQIESI
ncbi:protein JTB isoform X2 [Kryptolebias marmoratus]|uniref:protein JTB isoform X2 n=1 Tax=Kryptolebias marmoratus TaxID=37003 RepID=UPI0007F88B3D|nr:protein JTB isoform X2 [Kryptolebias marmoratus]